jgi:hypothetical protein
MTTAEIRTRKDRAGHRPRSTVQETGDLEHWGFIMISTVLGAAMVAEALLLLCIVWSSFGLATNDGALYTFSFQTMLCFGVFSISQTLQRGMHVSDKAAEGRQVVASLTALLITQGVWRLSIA